MVFPSWVNAGQGGFLVLCILKARESGTTSGLSFLSWSWWMQGQHPFTIVKITRFPPSRETGKCCRVVLCLFVRQFLRVLAKCAGLAKLCMLRLRQKLTGSPFPRPFPSWGCWLTAPACRTAPAHITVFGVKHSAILELSPSESAP